MASRERIRFRDRCLVLASGAASLGTTGCNTQEIAQTFIGAAGASLQQGAGAVLQGLTDGLFSLNGASAEDGGTTTGADAGETDTSSTGDEGGATTP